MVVIYLAIIITFVLRNHRVFNMNIEQRVRDLAKSKGLKMSELADRVDMTQTNLMVSIRNNPKLSTLEDIAKSLNVTIADIVDQQKTQTEGIAIINGETYTISKPQPDVVQVPHYKDYSILKHDIKSFIKTCIKKEEENSICGYVEMLEFFNLFYDEDSRTFFLSLYYSKGQVFTNTYSIFEFGKKGQWYVNDVIDAVWCDVEGVVPDRLGVNPEGITQEDIDKAKNL